MQVHVIADLSFPSRPHNNIDTNYDTASVFKEHSPFILFAMNKSAKNVFTVKLHSYILYFVLLRHFLHYFENC